MHSIPFGKADVKRVGQNVTAIATLVMTHCALAAANDLDNQGIEVEVIDLRTFAPPDMDTISTSIRKTHKVVI
ncbi:hypothetical protein ADN00_13480 [Ornatilinea apprima]|uniref:Transketolase C-terminal domain-containing protein n=1 Tax=Ornatilinea apprima TaxID=1134406 RepID=A0A0P6XIN4_9CHLR|nr:transketolase C-terminal domain-containing protein [Ornatilinea apprima]KPL74844.1 hypothetical protein ADN00_13480 [Ornatilinea apprima]